MDCGGAIHARARVGYEASFDASREITELRAEINRVNEISSRKEIEMHKLREELTLSRLRIVDLMNSTSWRVSAPIRFIRRMIGR